MAIPSLKVTFADDISESYPTSFIQFYASVKIHQRSVVVFETLFGLIDFCFVAVLFHV